MITFLALFLAGLFGGLLLGMIGVGMALVAVPVLTFSLPHLGVPPDLAPTVALATSMGIVTIGSVSSVVTHNRLGNIDWSSFRMIVPFSLIGVLAGSVLVTRLPADMLKLIFAAFLIFVGLKMLLSRKQRVQDRPVSAATYRAAGAAIGFAGALIGAGGGVFMVPFLSGRGWKMVRAVATSATIGLPVTVAGAVFTRCGRSGVDAPMLGTLHIEALLGIGFGSLIGAPFGARLASRVPGALLKRGFAVVLLILAVGLVLG
ncbi:sulfite exporter TauE/SafE family protein [Paracoccus cavernae]|uniref:Probable membrane transporter protein n=1 Tax=Paracoccus cavernae TaxID=1571207 RepID=A0ABT8DC65_9RHOB|nr:sulfite exporter TauE/SafE family protein [Paracoccus cavernae]